MGAQNPPHLLQDSTEPPFLHGWNGRQIQSARYLISAGLKIHHWTGLNYVSAFRCFWRSSLTISPLRWPWSDPMGHLISCCWVYIPIPTGSSCHLFRRVRGGSGGRRNRSAAGFPGAETDPLVSLSSRIQAYPDFSGSPANQVEIGRSGLAP